MLTLYVSFPDDENVYSKLVIIPPVKVKPEKYDDVKREIINLIEHEKKIVNGTADDECYESSEVKKKYFENPGECCLHLIEGMKQFESYFNDTNHPGLAEGDEGLVEGDEGLVEGDEGLVEGEEGLVEGEEGWAEGEVTIEKIEEEFKYDPEEYGNIINMLTGKVGMKDYTLGLNKIPAFMNELLGNMMCLKTGSPVGVLGPVFSLYIYYPEDDYTLVLIPPMKMEIEKYEKLRYEITNIIEHEKSIVNGSAPNFFYESEEVRVYYETNTNECYIYFIEGLGEFREIYNDEDINIDKLRKLLVYNPKNYDEIVNIFMQKVGYEKYSLGLGYIPSILDEIMKSMNT